MEALSWRIKTYASWAAACAGAFLAWIAGFELLDTIIESQTVLSVAATIYVVVSAAAVVVFSAVRQWTTIRKERYANITPLLHQLIHQIRDLQSLIATNEPSGSDGEAYKRFFNDCNIIFGRILDQLNTVYSSITSTHCRTSIKLTYPRNGELYVYTLARDQGSRQRCLKLDNWRVEHNHDALSLNPQFARLFDDGDEDWHYLCNDLTKEDFQSTSITAYDKKHATRAAPGTRRWQRRHWPLPYRSTIACVIRQGPIDIAENIPSEVLGFLTVDSESRGVFVERWDAQLMFTVADALYTPLRDYLDAQNRAPPAP
jgi:hypothetical protein